MDLTVTEEDGKLFVSTEDRNHTIMNLLRQAAWEAGGQAGYKKGHPYAGEATLVVEGDDPEALLRDAITEARDELDAFESAFDAA